MPRPKRELQQQRPKRNKKEGKEKREKLMNAKLPRRRLERKKSV